SADATIVCTEDSQCAAHNPGDTCVVMPGSCVPHPDVDPPNSLGWVGRPFDPSCRLYVGDEPDGTCTGVEYVARVVDGPVYRTWRETPLHIGDCEIVPVATYTVAATADEVSFTDALEVATIQKPALLNYNFGDVVGPPTNRCLGDHDVECESDTQCGANGPCEPVFAPPDGYCSVTDVSGFLLTLENRGEPGNPQPQAPLTWIDIHGGALEYGGCTSTETVCYDHSDCPARELCVGAFCSGTGEACYLEDDSYPCPVGETCVGPGFCAYGTHPCWNDAGCGVVVASCVWRVCSTSKTTCSSDLDCPSGEVCGVGVCTVDKCHDDLECVNTESCGRRKCSASEVRCAIDSDCPDTEVCNLASKSRAPNCVLNVQDLLGILTGITGATYTSYAEQVTPKDCSTIVIVPSAPVGGAIELSFETSASSVLAGEQLEVDVYASSNIDLSGYELALEVAGGTSGELALWETRIDDRPDYAFRPAGDPVYTYDATSKNEERLSCARSEGEIEETDQQPAYLATFVYQPVGGATGEFSIAIKGQGASFLTDEAGTVLPCEIQEQQVIVTVGIDCFQDTDCAPTECQTASCTNYECIYTNLPETTPCDDGMFCTKTDECDANGNCIGSGAKCPMFQPTCCELGDYCTCSTCQCAAQ
ncbi:MAG: hypothetical protein JSU63_06245, partial [Phycisphaerales bacterium]